LEVITRREELLVGRRFVLSVVADDPGSLVSSLVPEIARRFDIEEGLLSMQPLGPANFLLIFAG
jgi:hypothetical protein